MERFFLDLDRSDLLIQERDIKEDKTLVENLNILENEDKTLNAPIESIKAHLAKLFQIRRIVIQLVRKQIQWINNHSNMEFPIKQEDIQPLVRLVNKEGQILFQHGLSGFGGERELLIDIYNEIMPLKDKVKKTKLIAGRAAAPTMWTWIDGGIRVVKRYGGLLKGRKWNREEARKRFNTMFQFYEFLKGAGVRVPDHNSLHINEEWIKTKSGIKRTGYYQVVLSQEGLGTDVAYVYRNTNDEALIRRIYRQMLDQILKAINHNTHWMIDAKPDNFCWNGRYTTFVDTETSHYSPKDPYKGDFIIRTDLPFKEQMALMKSSTIVRSDKDHRWGRFRAADPRGNFANLLELCVCYNPDHKLVFEGETINFLAKHGRKRELRFLNRFIETPLYEEHVLKFVKELVPENLNKAVYMFETVKRPKGRVA